MNTIKKLIFCISILISFQNTVYAMSSDDEGQNDNPDIEYPESEPTDDTPKENIDLLDDKQFRLEARINGNLIEEYTKQTKLAEKNKKQKENWQRLQYCNDDSPDNSLDGLKKKNQSLRELIRDITEKNFAEQKKTERNESIKINNSIAINELLQIAEDSPVIKKKAEEYKQQRENDPRNPQIGSFKYEPGTNNFIISKIPSWSSLFFGYPTEHIKNIWRKPIQPVSTWEYIKSFWKPLPQIKEEPVKFEFVGFSNEMKKELEKLLTNKVIKNCTKITFIEDNNLATSKSVFDGDKVIPDHENPGYYFVHFDRTRNHSPYANLETRLKIVAHNIENNPDYDAWKKLMRWKVFYGIVLGGSAALQAYRFFHPPADVESTTNNSTQYIATAFAGTIGLFGGLLWGNKHKQTQEQKETEYRKAIVAKDGYYDDMAEDAALEPELLYNKKIKRLINDKEVELGDSLQEYGITMNPASQQRKDLIQYAQSQGYPRYKLPAISEE